MRMKKPERERFGANLRAARKAKEISQEELGFDCGLHRTAISLLERGKREPGLSTVAKLTTVLDISADAFLVGIEWLPKQRRFELQKPKRKAKGQR